MGEFRGNSILNLPDVQGKHDPFSVSFLDWIDKYGFFAKDVWKIDKNKWSGQGWMELFPFQRRILGNVLSQDEDYRFKYSTVLYSTTKKSGKTALSAAIGCWYAEVAPPGTEIYIIANDQEQAEGRVMRDMKYHAARRGYKITNFIIELPNGTFIQALTQSYRSVAGTRHGLTLWDELWGIQSELSRRTFEEMTPIPTIPWSLRVITTYAGFTNQSDLLWDLYLNGVGRDENEDGKGKLIHEMLDLPVWDNGTQFTYWNHDPTMPWQDYQYYADQRTQLRPMAYLRLHENRWVTTHEVFISEEWWLSSEKMEASADLWKDHPYAKYPIYISVDAAPKRDCTAVVGVAYDPEKGLAVDVFHKIWTPQDGELDFDATLQVYLLSQFRKYNIVRISYDPSHLHQLMTRLKNMKLPVVEFPQTVSMMTKASQNFYDLLRFGRFVTYKDEEARSHIRNTVAQAEGNGFRIVRHNHHMNAKYRKPIDYSVAVAMACYDAVKDVGIERLEDIRIDSPFADLTAYGTPEELDLPWMFRN